MPALLIFLKVAAWPCPARVLLCAVRRFACRCRSIRLVLHVTGFASYYILQQFYFVRRIKKAAGRVPPLFKTVRFYLAASAFLALAGAFLAAVFLAAGLAALAVTFLAALVSLASPSLG